MKANEWRRCHFSMTKLESPRSTKAGVHQHKASRAMLPPTVLSWVLLASGEHVVGQWCSWMDCDGELGPLHGMYGSMEVESEILQVCALLPTSGCSSPPCHRGLELVSGSFQEFRDFSRSTCHRILARRCRRWFILFWMECGVLRGLLLAWVVWGLRLRLLLLLLLLPGRSASVAAVERQLSKEDLARAVRVL